MFEKCFVYFVCMIILCLATYFPSRKGNGACGGPGMLWAALHLVLVFVLVISIPIASFLLWSWPGLPWGLIVSAVFVVFYYKKVG